MSKGGSSGGGDTTTTIRYAPYIEEVHESFLETSQASGVTARATNPYDDYESPDLNTAYFGIGYSIGSFPSLYDMYGKFMAGLDVELLWTQVLTGTQEDVTVSNLVESQAQNMKDNFQTHTYPVHQLGMRDINSVMSSTFIIGRDLLLTNLDQEIARFSAELKYKLIPVAAERWRAHLDWNRNVIEMYVKMHNQWFNTELAVDDQNHTMAAKHTLWPFTVLDFERANIAAMQGATSRTGVAGGEPSTAQKAIGGAVSGAALGSAAGFSPVLGGVLGLAASFF